VLGVGGGGGGGTVPAGPLVPPLSDTNMHMCLRSTDVTPSAPPSKVSLYLTTYSLHSKILISLYLAIR
jgi:hypothetical protein